MGLIKRLPPDVINRMAAGEILTRPCNAVKELVENSLDAGSTEITVTLQNSGLKMLQVMDNGSGIDKDEFELVCERFATSKLREFDDLTRMKTYGFRGEALASLSHVSKVNIVSRRESDACAYQGDFIDGKLVAPTRPSAGKRGTCITAIDMFYNFPQRKNKLAAHNEESRMVFDTLMKFAIHRPDVSFALRQNHSTDFRTKGDGNYKDAVSLLVGRDIAQDLIDLKLESTRLKFSFNGSMSMPTSAATSKAWQVKKSRHNVFGVFINGRIVNADVLKQPIVDVLNKRALMCQFCVVELKIDESRVDVNVHPTKSSVLFLEKDEIVEEIQQYIEKVMKECFGEGSSIEQVNEDDNNELDKSYSLTFLGSQKIRSVESVRNQTKMKIPGVEKIRSSEKKRIDYMEVRTDSKERKIDEFIQKSANNSIAECSSRDCANEVDDGVEEICDSQNSTITSINDNEVSMISIKRTEDGEELMLEADMKPTYRTFNFESLTQLRTSIVSRASQTLRELFKTFIYVGCVDPETVLVQFGTSLYLINFCQVLREFFYQMSIMSFGNFGTFKISDEMPSVKDLLSELLELSRHDENYKEFAVFESHEKRKDAEELLSVHAEMLYDYFSLKLDWIDLGEENSKALYVTAIPSLVHSYVPQLEKLPFLIGSLVLDVDYENESKTFHMICRAIADFFTIHKCFVEEKSLSAFSTTPWETAIRQTLVPLVKKKLIPSDDQREHIKQLADSHDLYKVFERCGGG